MRFHALACDYDGTVAKDGILDDPTRRALDRLRGTGRKVILVTGRRIEDLKVACPDLSAFDAVVGENGAVLYWPAKNELRALAEAPPPAFAERLSRAGVREVAVGHVIVATWQPYELMVLDAIRDLGLELQVIFNKGAVMVLPSGVNKGTGLRAALDDLGLSPHNAVSIGDAENDHALLAACECGAAVANALPVLKERADLVTVAERGAGVAELAGRLIDDDLASVADRLARHDLPIGTDASNGTVALPAYGATVLLTGTSGAGKSTFATAFFERLDERGYGYCIVDPEGDYSELSRAIVIGSRQSAPDLDDVMKALDRPAQGLVMNLLGVPLQDRPAILSGLAPRLQASRAHSGHPHWLIIDEAHHLSPRTEPAAAIAPAGADLKNLFLITVHPGHVAPAMLSGVDVVVVVGASPQETLAEIAGVLAVPAPQVGPQPLKAGEALVWWPRRSGTTVIPIQTIAPEMERRRHVRKYATGELPVENSFYFRGPEGKLNLRAQNLMSFLQIAQGVDDATWLFHLRAGDYSRWVTNVIKDEPLAAEIAAIEKEHESDDRATAGGEGGSAEVEEAAAAALSRSAVKAAIERQYTAPH
jgi:HAD superfamily hydrolase (TIGR01484 family)